MYVELRWRRVNVVQVLRNVSKYWGRANGTILPRVPLALLTARRCRTPAVVFSFLSVMSAYTKHGQ